MFHSEDENIVVGNLCLHIYLKVLKLYKFSRGVVETNKFVNVK